MLVPLALAAVLVASPAAADCTAQEASWEWGFKESFRAYVSGSIANGEWTTSGDIGYETPAFFAENVVGDLRLRTATGQLAVDGAMRFTGHEGILDTTLERIRLDFEGFDRVALVADVTGTTQSFEEVDAADVRFLTGDLDAAQWTAGEGVLTISDIPLTLTAEGSAAFGTYPEGEAFDPMTIVVTASDACVADALTERSSQAGRLVVAWVLAAGGAIAAGVFLVLGALRLRSRRVSRTNDN